MLGRFLTSGNMQCIESVRQNTGHSLKWMQRWLDTFLALSLRVAAPLCFCLGGATVMLLTSCEKHRQGPPPPVVTTEQDRIVSSLQRIGQRAESIVLAVPAEDWPRVYAYVREIDDAWKDYKRPTVQPSSEPERYPARLLVRQLDAALAALKSAAATRDRARTMKAANDVNAVAIDLFAFYNPGMPPDMYRLTVLERRILLDSADGDLTRASATLNHVRGAWGRVRATISGHVGNTVVSEFDRRIADQQAALDANDSDRLSATARQALTMIDQMQRLYYPHTEGLG